MISQEKNTAIECFVFLLSALTARGPDFWPTKFSSQIVAFTLLIFGILTYYFWEAMLVSYLSSKMIVMPFHSVDELISNTNFKVAVLSGSYQEDSIRLSMDDKWQNLWTQRIEPYIEEYKNIKTERVFSEKLSSDTGTAFYNSITTTM